MNNSVFSKNKSENKKSLILQKKNLIRKIILDNLYLHGNKTIPEISALLNFSIPSTTSVINDLISEEWLLDFGTGTTKIGRKPSIYGLKPKTKFNLIIEINRYNARLVVIDATNQICSEKLIFISFENVQKSLNQLIDRIVEIKNDLLISNSQLLSIGIIMPGLVNSNLGINYTYLNIGDKSITRFIEDKIQIPVYLENDANAMAIGEFHFGAGNQNKNSLFVNIDKGIGLGIVLDGKIYHGTSGFSGELGHIPVKIDGDLCACGKHGCLETIAAIPSIINNLKELLQSGKVSKMLELTNGNLDKININHILDAVNQGDVLIIDLLSEVGYEIGKALSIVIHLFNPGIIIIGGQLSKAGQIISNPIELMINKLCIQKIKNDVRIEFSQLGNNAGVLGMQAYVMAKLLNKIEN